MVNFNKAKDTLITYRTGGKFYHLFDDVNPIFLTAHPTLLNTFGSLRLHLVTHTHTHSPGFWLSEVEVVDAIQVHILCVPGEGGLPHPKIEIWCVDPLYGNTTILLDNIQDGVQVSNVPLIYILGKSETRV